MKAKLLLDLLKRFTDEELLEMNVCVFIKGLNYSFNAGGTNLEIKEHRYFYASPKIEQNLFIVVDDGKVKTDERDETDERD